MSNIDWKTVKGNKVGFDDENKEIIAPAFYKDYKKKQGWFEQKQLVQTGEGIKEVAPVHREVAIKHSYGNTLKTPLLPESPKSLNTKDTYLLYGDNKMSKQFKVYKDAIKHEFVIDIEEGVGVNIKLDGKPAIYDAGVLKFLSSQKINKQTVNGISIPDNIKKEIEDARARVKEKRQLEIIDREADRPSPKIDENKFFIYSIGFESHRIYPQSHEKAITNIIKSGIEPDMVFSGSRNKTRKYPETHDDHIPASYVKKDGDKYSAEGYASVWSEDVFAFPIEIVEAEINKIKEQKLKLKSEKEARISAIFAKARATGEKQILNKWSEECNDPEESCDIDNIIEYAMPDGTVKTERHHTY